jgi:hypothetical protein
VLTRDHHHVLAERAERLTGLVASRRRQVEELAVKRDGLAKQLASYYPRDHSIWRAVSAFSISLTVSVVYLLPRFLAIFR